jgi:hypothetical protein
MDDFPVPNPFSRAIDIKVRIEVNGIAYGARFPNDTDPEAIAELVKKTIEIANAERRVVYASEVE